MPGNKQNIFRYVNYLLAALIVITGLFLIRNIVNISFSGGQSESAEAEDNSKKTAAVRKKDIMNYSNILEKNPFGQPMKLIPIAALKQQEKSYETPSDLLLIGTVTGPDSLSYGIFEDKSQSPSKQEVFALGENVFNYGTLKQINSTSVRIEQDSAVFTLSIPFDYKSPVTDINKTPLSSNMQTSFAKQIGERDYILDSRKVQNSIENPEKIMTDARLLPNFENGKQKGFKISEVIPDGLYHNLGLRDGDILLRVNGLSISNPEVAIQAMSALRGMNRVNLDIIRNDENLSMNYQLR
jgi:general secretion pathway protein C